MNQHIHGGDIYRYPDILDFSANINPLGTPKSVIKAAEKGLHKIEHYPDVKKEELVTALSVYEQVPETFIICGNGAAELIFAVVWAKKPKKALLAAPTFAEYEQALKSTGCQVEYFYLKEEDGFTVTEKILEQITPEQDILFLCNPNNPTGVLIDPVLLDEILKICRKHGVFLVLDECFVDFLDCPKKAEKKAYLTEFENLFILKAFTKRYAMAGLRLGYGLCSNQQLLWDMHSVMQPWNISIPAQEAGVAALREENYVNLARKLVQTERNYLKEELCKLGLRVYDSRANYLFFRGPKELGRRMLEQKIMLRDCSNYPGLSGGYYRIAVRTHRENEKLVSCMRQVLKEAAACGI